MMVIDRRPSPFGIIRILERRHDGARLYFLNQGLQTMVQRGGASLIGYVHAIKLLLGDAGSVLMLGGGGGSLATMLARRDHAVTVVDVDPSAAHLAKSYFDLDPRVIWITADAFAFLDGCSQRFDAVVVDACDAHGLINAFSSPRGLSTALAVVRPGGSLIVNLASQDGPSRFGMRLLEAMRAEGLNATLFQPGEEVGESNELLHVRTVGPTHRLDISDVRDRPAEVRSYLMSLRPVPPDANADSVPATGLS